MMKEETKELGINGFFNGEMVFDPSMGVFCEVNKKWLEMYAKSNFKQTLMGASGIADNEILNGLMATIPNKYVIYKPDGKKGAVKTDKGKEAINIYRGVSFEGYKGKKIPKRINQILDNLFLSEPKAKEIFINWMAFVIQKRKLSGVAWGLFGKSGSGKGLIVEIMRTMVGARNTSFGITDTDLQSTFNPYAMHVLFMQLNEVASDMHGRHGVAGKLKTYVTDPYIRINQKGIGEIEVENYLNVILNSNNNNPLELDADDRRWNMIVSKKSLKDTYGSWGSKEAKEARGEAMEFGAYLMNYKVSKKKATSPMKMNEGKAGVIALTTTTTQQVCRLINEGGDVLEFLDLNESNIKVDEIKIAVKDRAWSNDLLTYIYQTITGNDKKTVYEMNRALKSHLDGVKVGKFYIRVDIDEKKKTKETRGVRYEH